MRKKTLRQMKKTRILKTAANPIFLAALLGLTLLLAFSSSCGDNSSTNTQQPAANAVEPPRNEFEAELRAFRDADFTYIFSFKRKDGLPMNADDKRFVKENSHFYTNRFTLTTGETVIFAGSNFKFDNKALDALKERFEVRDFSKPERVLEKRRTEIDSNDGNTTVER